ncbi:MAG: GNAT family N-acetyltransferase [Betaproteobacteria bacterium]
MADYPKALEQRRRLPDGRTVLIRPIRADDAPSEQQFLDRLSGDTRRRRFMKYAGSVNGALVHFFTHIDYDRHMAFVCEASIDGEPQLVGDARYVANPGGASCEFGIVVADDWHHSGIARLLMTALIRAARERGFETMEGLVMSDNADMLGFVRALGFEVSEAPKQAPPVVRVAKKL